MTEALVVEDGEALDLARELAERRGTSVARAVVEALRSSIDRLPPRAGLASSPEAMTPAQQTRYDAIMELAHAVSARRLPGATSNHDDLYDAHGLPR